MKKEIQILLVDDHQVVRDGLQRMLEQEDDLLVVGQSSNGEETLSMIDELSPDVVMMDIKMPGVDGIELTRQVKRKHPSSNIIMLTLYDQYLTQAMEAGARGYLLKDIKREELTQAIRQVHSGQVVIGESIKSNAQQDYEDQRSRKEEKTLDTMIEEVQIVLAPPIEARQLMRLASRIETALNSRVLQMVGAWQEGTIMTILLNTAMALTDILDIFTDMPEVEAVGDECLSEKVNPNLLKKAGTIPRLRNRVSKTIFVALEKE